MNRASTLFKRFVLVTLLIGLLSACGNPSTRPPDIDLDNVPLKSADFDGTTNEGKIGDVPVFVGVGSLTNDSGQVLEITVTGTAAETVVGYFNTAKFFFAVVDPVEIPETNELLEKEPNLSVVEIMKGEGTENLSVTFKLSKATADKYRVGAVLLVVDPTVAQNRYNHYAAVDPLSNTASVSITASQGQVTGRLYRACALIQSGNALPGTPKTLSATGAGSFDFTVKGTAAGDNIYRVTGRWNYDYTQDLADAVGGEVC
jgi:hypothetical protein